MKCSQCGSELNENAIYCEECGTRILREKKCPNCGFTTIPTVKFCMECGYRFPAPGVPGAPWNAGVPIGDRNVTADDVNQTCTQKGSDRDSAVASLGDKNMIARDVNQVAIKENIHVEGGGTFVKNEDETKKLARCHVCNGNRAVSDGFICCGCNRFTCKDCYDRDLMLCKTCKETEYRKAFQAARENGMKVLSPEQIRNLETKYRIRPDRAADLCLEVIRTVQRMQNGAQSGLDDESDVEFKLFAEGNIRDAYAILLGEARIDPYNAEALARRLYAALKIASVQNENNLFAVPNEAQKEKTFKAQKGKQPPGRNISAESAAEDAGQIVELAFIPGNDTPGVYLVLIDQALEGQPFPESVEKTLKKVFDANAVKDYLDFARRLLDRAKELWPGNVLLKCRRIIYFLKLFEQTRLSKCRMEANELLKSLPTDSPSVMERSWLAKVRGLMQGGLFDPTPQYCEENGGLYFFVLNPWSSESYYKKAKSFLSGNKKTLSPYDKKCYFQLLEIAATKFGSPSAEILTKYADCLANGFGTDQDTKTALEFYRKAAEADGINIIIEGTVFKSYQDHGTHTEYAVPNGITKIANGAFAEAQLKKITIPLTVSSVEEDFAPSCALQFVGDSAVEATSFDFDGCVFSVPEITGIRTALHSFSRKVRNAEDRVSWCNPSITPNCDRKCESCLLYLEKGIAAQKILAFLTFAMKFCEEHGIRVSMPDTPKYMDAAFALAEGYAHRGSGKTQDVSRAAAWYREAAERGHAEAQFLFAGCCFDGAGTQEDKAESVKWYRKAAGQGIAGAQLKLAGCCFDGIGTHEDKAGAFGWYQKAIGSIPGTDARSMYQIGECFHNGWGTKRDDSEAVKWYRKAAEQGLGAAQFELAGCCISGFGMKQDKTEAFEWYRQADEKGITDARAQMILGEGYFNGWGMNSVDYDKALAAYRKATAGDGNCFFADCTPRLLLEHITEIAANRTEEDVRNMAAQILRDVFTKTENCSGLDGGNWVSFLTLTDGIPLEHCDWESFTGKNWVDLLSIKPKYAEYCGLTPDSQKIYWTKIIDDQLKTLADKQPEFRFVYDLRTGRNVAEYLRDHPEMIRFCNWIRVSRPEWIVILRNVELTRRLVKSDPDILSKYCPWDCFNDEDRVYLLSICPEYACHCKKNLSAEGWSRILKNAELTRRLVESDPEFLASCPWNDFTGSLWSDLLSLRPEYESCYNHPTMARYVFLNSGHAGSPVREPYAISKEGWIRILKSDAADRFLSVPGSPNAAAQDAGRKGFQALLASCPWEILAWEDWVSLLSVRPEYVRFFKWEKFRKEDHGPLRKIGDRLLRYVDVNRLPFVAISRMCWGDRYRNWDKLTPGEWCGILKEYPGLAEYCKCWDRFTCPDWVELLSQRPKFKDNCGAWKEFSPEEWDELLDAQPELLRKYPVHDLHRILNYSDISSNSPVFTPLARRFSFLATSAFLLVFSFLSLWGPTGWFRLFGESPRHALISGAVWITASVFVAWGYSVFWGPIFDKLHWMNLVYAGFVSFSLYTFYHWSFLFSRWSIGLICCAAVPVLLFVIVAAQQMSCEYKYTLDWWNLSELFPRCVRAYPCFAVFSWFLLSPVVWSTWMIAGVVLMCIISLVAPWFFSKCSMSPVPSFVSFFVPPLVIGIWFLFSPVNPHACYKMANELQTSFPSASQALYRKGQAADPDFVQLNLSNSLDQTRDGESD